MNEMDIWQIAYRQVQSQSPKEALEWFRQIPSPSTIPDEQFLEELAWCVYNAGMKEQVVRSKWPDIRKVFHEFVPQLIVEKETTILELIVLFFNHKKKAQAVIDGAKKVIHDQPIRNLLATFTDAEALEYLETYPFIGKITKYHLARNIGFDVVKPDRHLVRLANHFQTDPFILVERIATVTHFRRGFIDFELWQWMAWGATGLGGNSRS